MASVDKFTDSAMCNMMRHNNRATIEPSNVDIDKTRSSQNYSFDMDHGGMSDYKYYKQLVASKYLYGRGTQREADAITGCGWVVTAPKEICGDRSKEMAFFKGVFDFVCDRYGKENILNNAVHYDEGGAPHIHIIFCPVTELDHEKVQFKTVPTKQVVKTESGRYEFGFRFKLDVSGQRIPVRNYARMTDYYDQKISANDVVNKIELRNFHPDLQKYLDDHGIEGRVITGKSGGINYTVEELKEFTKKTGLRLEEVQEMLGDRSLLEGFVLQHGKVKDLEKILSEKDTVIETLREEMLRRDKSVEVSQKDAQIKELTRTIAEKDQQIASTTDSNLELRQKVDTLETTLSEKQKELDRANDRIKTLENEKTVTASQTKESTTTTSGWEHGTGEWGARSQSSGWGTHKTNVEEEKTW